MSLGINNPLLLIHNLNDRNYLVTKEILKMFMNQISSLKKLTYCCCLFNNITNNNISFNYFPRAKDCLTDLSELHCSSNINFDRLSQICHNLQSLTIDIGGKGEGEVSNGLKELISSFSEGRRRLRISGP